MQRSVLSALYIEHGDRGMFTVVLRLAWPRASECCRTPACHSQAQTEDTPCRKTHQNTARHSKAYSQDMHRGHPLVLVRVPVFLLVSSCFSLFGLDFPMFLLGFQSLSFSCLFLSAVA